MAKVRVGINGFGRIGRLLFRAGIDEVDFVGINNLGNPEIAAHLLKYDSTHGKFKGEVIAGKDHLQVNGKKIPMSASKDPAAVPWKNWETDIVLECTGAFKDRDALVPHLNGGAKRVINSSPLPGADLTIVMGVNENKYDPSKHKIVSNASCTTNCLAPLVKVLHESIGVEKGTMTTIHSYTNDQRILDTDHKDFRRARAAALSIIPTSTGAAKAVGEVLPEMKGKIDGNSFRVPTPDVSVVDFVFIAKKNTTKEEVNAALQKAANGPMKGILRCEKDPLVSSDFIGDTASSIVDLECTMVMDGNLVKVYSWYDNEVGFSHRMIDLTKYMAEKGL